MKGRGQLVRKEDQHQMNSAALVYLHTQGCGHDGCEGVEEGVRPWRLLSLDTHIQSLY